MSSPLAALAKAYQRHLDWSRALPHLGLPAAKRGVPPSSYPPAVVANITSKSKDQRAIGVAYGGQPVALAAPVSWPEMRQIVIYLVHAGAHPDDILVWDYDPETDAVTCVRTAVDHLLWTHEDQRALEATNG